jgi:hypothetical protein
MEDFDVEKAAKATKKRKLAPNHIESNVEAQVAKSIKDNFRGFGPAEVDGTAIDGVTLRDQIRMDKATNAVTPGSITMGRKYYADLRLKYAGGDNPDKLLTDCVVDPAATITPSLFQAMVKAKNHPINRQPMLEYMSICPEPKREELIGIYRLCQSLHPTVSTDQHLFVMETARFAARLKLMDKFPKETLIMVPKFSEAMLKALMG